MILGHNQVTVVSPLHNVFSTSVNCHFSYGHHVAAFYR